MNMEKTLYLIDGHALVFKMYYALSGHPMINSKGVDTSILYGFTKYVLETDIWMNEKTNATVIS